MNWRKWLDDCNLAAQGILLATREKRFWLGFIPTFIIFNLLINLLSGGFAKFELMSAVGFSGSMKILSDALFSTIGINQNFSDWLYQFALSFLQATLIGLIVLLWRKKTEQTEHQKPPKTEHTEQNNNNLTSAGLITGLVALGAGCPTCGTTLLTPLLGALFSTGSLAVVGAISTLVTILAIFIALFSLRRLGLETYVIIVNERYLKNHAKVPKTA